jgi:hypothetical protein
LQVDEQLRLPVVPQPERQLDEEPAAQVKSSSTNVSQSSSVPLQASTGARQVPHPQLPEQVRIPAEPQAVVQLPVVPAMQVKPSSREPSQLSSTPLHASLGGVHIPQPQVPEQIRLPVEPQLVLHGPVEP